MHLTQTSKNIAAKLVHILAKMPTIHYRHLHQHQQRFVTLISPSLFYAAPQIRCILQTTYPELEAEESRALHNQRQLAEPLIYLFIYFIFLSAIMRNLIQTSCSNSPVFIWISASVQSIYLLYIVCSSAPSKNFPPCTFKSICLTLACI